MNGAVMVTGGGSVSRPLFSFHGEDGLEGGAGRAALAWISHSLASDRACWLLIQMLPVSGVRPDMPCPYQEGGLSEGFRVWSTGLPRKPSRATLSVPPACMERAFG